MEGELVDSSGKDKATRVVIVNYGRFNRGTEALLITRIAALRRFISNVSFTVFMYRLDPDAQKTFPGVSFYEVIGQVALHRMGIWAGLRTAPPLIRCALWRFFRHFHLNAQTLLKDPRLNAYSSADVVLTVGGDTLTEDYGTLGFWSCFLNLLFGLLLAKQVVIYAESIGPFKRRYNRIIARFLFNRAKLITLRDNTSARILRELPVSNPSVYVTADSAFLLEPAPPDRVKEILNEEGIPTDQRPIIGIMPSYLIPSYGSDRAVTPQESYDRYVRLISQIADYLVDTLNAIVLLVPHVTIPEWASHIDDRTAANDIYHLSQRRDHIFRIKGEYSAEETKAIIGICDLCISSRMHAAISSTSLSIPTIALAYSHKTYGIIGEMVGCKQYVLDINELNYESLVSKINTAWMNRESIREGLDAAIKPIKQEALKNAELVSKLVE
jgi:polysaccharide pyruvyl transferase WcaK-like protein